MVDEREDSLLEGPSRGVIPCPPKEGLRPTPSTGASSSLSTEHAGLPIAGR